MRESANIFMGIFFAILSIVLFTVTILGSIPGRPSINGGNWDYGTFLILTACTLSVASYLLLTED